MIDTAEVQELCRRLKERGELIHGSKVYRATLPDSGVTMQIYYTVESDLRTQSTVVQDDDLTWFLVIKGWNYYYEMTRRERGKMVFGLREPTVELRGDREKFMAHMTLCRMFDELKPNDDVRMAS